MSFNSFEYFVFLTIVFFLYWSFNKKHKIQNVFILIANYFFYGWYDYRFLILIISCSLIDYFISFRIYKSKRFKLLFLSLSLTVNLGVLILFKYCNFFIGGLASGLALLHLKTPVHKLNVVLPIGISFFTFQTLGYAIDIYKGKLKPTRDVIAFLNFTSFFPQMLAGPIERGSKMIPQFLSQRKFNYPLAAEGTRQIMYGLFKKIVIADKVGVKVDYTFSNYGSLSSAELLLGAMFFYIQLYADFSGYSDIAIGTGKLLGFELSTNFQTPLFAKTAPDAWARWHITLTQWFKDYVYQPLLFKNKQSTIWRIFCVILLMVLIGLWHGANLTFIAFGLLHGLYFIPHVLSKKSPRLKRILLLFKTNHFLSAISMLTIFTVSAVTTVFFRSDNINYAFNYLHQLFIFDFFVPSFFYLKIIPLLGIFFLWEWFQKDNKYQFYLIDKPRAIKIALDYTTLFAILVLGRFSDPKFIYFKF